MMLILIKFFHNVKYSYRNNHLKDMHKPFLFGEFGSVWRKSFCVNIVGQMWQPIWMASSAALDK